MVICSVAAIGHSSAYVQIDHHGYDGGNEDGSYDHGNHDQQDYYAPANYKFGYAVKDPHTGDDKEAWEHRQGDQVKGSYSLVEPDGTKRIVDYSADKHNGFNAIVKKIGHAHHPIDHHQGGW